MRVVFEDPILATLEVLRAELPLLVETSDVACGSLQVEDATADPSVSLPYLGVFLDDSDTRYPVTETALLRLSVWAGEPWRTLEIAQVARAVLRDHWGPKARSYGDPSTGPISTEDPDSGQPLATMTISARMKPKNL